jgi:hypothetical protein
MAVSDAAPQVREPAVWHSEGNGSRSGFLHARGPQIGPHRSPARNSRSR